MLGVVVSGEVELLVATECFVSAGRGPAPAGGVASVHPASAIVVKIATATPPCRTRRAEDLTMGSVCLDDGLT